MKSNKMRTVLGDMLFFKPNTFEKHFVQFTKPINKVRATATSLILNYLYIYGGILESGEISNHLIRINLEGSKSEKGFFEWNDIPISIKP